MTNKIINLQLFALNVNVTTANSSGNHLTPEMKTYYDMQLLEDCKPYLVHGQFAQKRNIPKGNSKTINWRKFSSLGKATTALTEGVTPDGQNLDVTQIDATVAQYGGYVTVSDLLELTAVDPIINETSKLIANQAGVTLDTIVRNALVGGTVVQYATPCTSTNPEVASRSSLSSDYRVKVVDILRAVRTLKRKNVPTINGYYIAIVHPDVAFDLMRDPEFVEWHKYCSPDELYEGEIGKIGKCRFVESTEAKIWKDSTCPSTTVSEQTVYTPVYATLVLGADAYGDTEVAGGGLEMIVKQKGSAGTADPLDQRSTIGWKATKVAKILSQERMVRLESCASFGNTAEAN